ncbi:MAG: lysophospholipid acyltransferase family protein [Microscillaceae bacterium]|jgi:KDO2-lipid IV(A) lauroyltransferase|nr:lysophospholipid acyltransferase family protein [Microscillaceae bacterium]
MQSILFYLLLPILSGIAYLPFWFLYRLADGLFLITYYIIGYRKKVVLKNLRQAFPEKSAFEIRQIARRFYVFFCDMLLETLKMLVMSQQAMSKRVRFNHLDLAEYFAQKNQSFFIVLGHSGSWEWASPGFELQTPFHVLVIYKPLANPMMDNLVLKLRTRYGQEATSMKNTVRNILRLKDKLTITAFIGDQRPENPRDAYWTDFLGQRTDFMQGTEKLAQKFNRPVVFAAISRPRRGHYVIDFELISENPQATAEGEITEQFVRKLEQQIRQNPELWLWSHNRWKHTQLEKTATSETQ